MRHLCREVSEEDYSLKDNFWKDIFGYDYEE